MDVELKRVRFAAAGCPAYWVVDPDALTLTAWELTDREYLEVAQVARDETFQTDKPYPAQIIPAELVD